MVYLLRLCWISMVVVCLQRCQSVNDGEVTAEFTFPLTSEQPWLRQLFYWDGRIVAHAGDIFYAIDIQGKRAVPIHSIGDRSVVSFTTAFGHAHVLVRDGSYYSLWYRNADGWGWLHPPKDISFVDYKIAVGGEHYLVLLAKDRAKVYDGQNWWDVELTYDLKCEASDAFCIWDNRLFVGRDRGEWGGGLHSIDLRTGKGTVEIAEIANAPVTDLTIGPDGNLFVVSGQSHMGMYNSRIIKVTPESIGTLVHVDYNGTKIGDWPYDPTSFSALDFDEHGEMVLLTDGLGLFRSVNGEWTHEPPRWKQHLYLKDFIMINDTTSLFGISSSGLLLVDREKKKLDRIYFATLLNDWEKQ